MAQNIAKRKQYPPESMVITNHRPKYYDVVVNGMHSNLAQYRTAGSSPYICNGIEPLVLGYNLF